MFGSFVQMALILVALLQSDLVNVPLLDEGVDLVGLVVAVDASLPDFVTSLVLCSDYCHVFHLL